MNQKVIVPLFGATNGFSIHIFGSQDGLVEITPRIKIPWETDDESGLFWPITWLHSALWMARSYAQPGDIIAGGMWGADFVCMNRGNPFPIYEPRHYACVPKDIHEALFNKRSAGDFYEGTNGANVNFFQPVGQFKLEVLKRPHIFEADILMPLGDFMTEWIRSGYAYPPLRVEEYRHDPYMAQSYGIYTGNARKTYGQVFGEQIAQKLVPNGFFGLDQVIRTPDGIFLCPFSHDSVFARMVGFSESDWVIWSGTWLGTATLVGDQVVPQASMHEAGIAFEGLGKTRAIITNIAMLGRYYKMLLTKVGLNYSSAQQTCQAFLNSTGLLFRVQDLPEEEGDNAVVEWIFAKAGQNGGKAVVALIKAAAQACADKIEATAKILDLQIPEKVAIIGGWAENTIFRKVLGDYGFLAVKPRFALIATQAGLAAHALLRTQPELEGDFANALSLLHKWSESSED